MRYFLALFLNVSKSMPIHGLVAQLWGSPAPFGLVEYGRLEETVLGIGIPDPWILWISFL